MPGIRRHHWIVLFAILVVAAFLRFHKITHEGATLDELWSISLAAGRSANLPVNQIVDPPPQMLFVGAPAVWHIWTNMDNTTHPPLYFMLLRLWVDIFGQSDFAIRSLSVLLSLAAIILMFDVVRRISGAGAGLLAAAACAFAWSQIDLSQDARNYTINFLTILLATHAVVRIAQAAPNAGNVLQLFLAATASLLSHYFSLFTLLGIAAYALTLLRGQKRMAILGSLLASLGFTVMVWGKWFLIQFHQRDALTAPGGVPWASANEHFLEHAWSAVKVIAEHLYGRENVLNVYSCLDPFALLTILFVTALIVIVPLFSLRAKPILMLFWCQIIATIGGIATMDFVRHTSMIDWVRYSSMAAPAICALAVAPLALPKQFPPFWKWLTPAAVLFSLVISAAAQYQIGPRPKEDFRFFADKLDAMAGPTDLLVFYTPSRIPPFYWLIDLDHYHPNSRPILILDSPAGPDLLARLELHGSPLFLIGDDAPADGPALLPDWRPVRTFINTEAKGVPSIGGSIAQMDLQSVIIPKNKP
jgi:hypothetical protein